MLSIVCDRSKVRMLMSKVNNYKKDFMVLRRLRFISKYILNLRNFYIGANFSKKINPRMNKNKGDAQCCGSYRGKKLEKNY